jgi:tripartite-type tricarboxylate transporter receptor subunit TctC
LAVLSGEADAVSASVQEVSEHVKSGSLRILLTTEDKRIGFSEFAQVPAITELYPQSAKYFPSFQWLGFAVPADTPSHIVNKLGGAFATVMASQATDSFYNAQYLEKIAMWGKDADRYVTNMQSVLSWMAWDLGVATNDPAKMNIPKPANW